MSGLPPQGAGKDAFVPRESPNLWWPIAVGLGLLATVGLILWGMQPSAEELLHQAEQAMARANYVVAEQLAQQALAESSDLPAALLLAGHAASKQGQTERALSYYDRIEDDGGRETIQALSMSADLLLYHEGRLSEAETRYRRVLVHDPDQMPAHFGLMTLLTMEGRRWESSPHLLHLVQKGNVSEQQLFLLGDLDRVVLSTSFPRGQRVVQVDHADFLQSSWDETSDPAPLIGLAGIAQRHNRNAEAKELLQKVVTAAPQQMEAQARLGELLLDSSTEEFLTWRAALPKAAKEHPITWFVLGTWAQNQSELRVAVRCFWECVRRDANHIAANFQLAQVLSKLGQPDQAAPFRDRATRLSELRRLLSVLSGDPRYEDARNQERMRRAAELTGDLGRVWESWAWSRVALRFDPNVAWAQERIESLQPQLGRNPRQTLPWANPAVEHDLSSYPLPDWRRPELAGMIQTQSVLDGEVTFVDMGSAAGLDFTYFNGAEPEESGRRMHETNGGGVAVLDYDCDGWPDIYLTQGCPWPPQPDQSRYLDRLYRNLGNGRFQDVTAQAQLAENRYSQGATVGDVNDDGFPDLYVANLGGNRLYLNDGCGTFSDISDTLANDAKQWTTSCLIADLNGDTWPDIYAVNYLAGPNLFDRLCSDGLPCAPGDFDGAQDQLYLSLGDGRFEERTAAAGVQQPNGNGMGIVAADFDGSGRLGLFVANDEAPNFFFLNETTQRGGALSFVEQAALSGLAYDERGLAQACMGIAADDADADGLLDLFITNFANQSNTLYVGLPGNQFEDGTRKAGLRDPSFALLGFGTQFLDGELDGWPDLVLTNGHVDNYSRDGRAYRMRPQYFHNVERGRFAEVPSKRLRGYFEGEYVGRSLARVDWNRDGLDDFVVSHLHSPAALVTNRTRNAGHFLAVRLRGVASDRDAIGAILRLTADEQTWVRQLTAGDGFQASNQRQLIFGVGNRDRVDELTVRWPSGLRQTFGNLPVDHEVLLIEGQADGIQGSPVERAGGF